VANIKQIIVIRKDLKMRRGKEIAQGSHASMAWLANKIRNAGVKDFLENNNWEINSFELTWEEYSWFTGSFAKVCLQVDTEQELLDIYQKAKEANLTVHLITDAGRTEFNGVPTNTCLAIGPHESEKIDVITGHLKLY
jgi:PTH2 family peptidyl-tRNA hydrolase